MVLPRRGSLRCALLVGSTLLVGCGPSDAELQALIDARVEAQLNPVTARLEQKGVLETAAQLERQAAADATKSETQRSNEFLATLDRLMEDYQPTLPEVVDDTDVLSCVTAAGFEQDPNLKAAARVLYADMEAAKRARNEAARTFERRRWLQYRIDYGWQGRVASKTAPGGERCGDDRWGDWGCWDVPTRFLDTFGNDEFDRLGQHLYSRGEVAAMPLLMTKLSDAGLPVPERFWCAVTAAEIGRKEAGYPLIVACEGQVQSFIQLSGDRPMVHVGDVISLPLRDKQVDPEGVITKVGAGKIWRVSGAWSEVRVEVPAECPSDELIAYKALQKTRSPRDAAPLIAMLRAAPATTPASKKLLADDDLRAKRYADAGKLYRELADPVGMRAAAEGLAKANDVAGAIGLLREVVAGAPDASMLQLLGGLEIQAGETAQGQQHLRAAIAAATDLKIVKAAQAVLQFSGDAEGAAQAKLKACALGDKRSCG